MTRIDLPWPSRTLHPNARVHWARKAKAVKKARADAVVCAKIAGASPMQGNSLAVTATFFPPDMRHRDIDGMLSSIKPYLDGIADVIGIDDSKWAIAIKKGEPRPLGAVQITIEAA